MGNKYLSFFYRTFAIKSYFNFCTIQMVNYKCLMKIGPCWHKVLPLSQSVEILKWNYLCQSSVKLKLWRRHSWVKTFRGTVSWCTSLEQSKKTVNFILLRTCRRTTHFFSLRMSISSILMIGPGHLCARKFTDIRNSEAPPAEVVLAQVLAVRASTEGQTFAQLWIDRSSADVHFVRKFSYNPPKSALDSWFHHLGFLNMSLLGWRSAIFKSIVPGGYRRWLNFSNRPTPDKFWCNVVARFLLSYHPEIGNATTTKLLSENTAIKMS